jgi:ABC-type multidrug transport system fused ATPase/permease subunit
MLKKFKNSQIGKSFTVLSRSDLLRIGMVTVLQIFMSILDLLGVALIGVLGALAVSGVESHQPGNRVSTVLRYMQIQNLSFQKQALVLGVLATITFITRTIFSIIFTRRILFFLSRRAAVISSHLISRLLRQNLLKIQEKTMQETLYAVTSGVTSITLGIIGNLVTIISDSAILFVMFAGLLVVSPSVAISTFFIFFGIGLSLYFLLHKKARALGESEAQLTITSNQKIMEVLSSYRESVVRNRREFYSDEIGKSRLDLANTLAQQSFMPNVSKYVIETTTILGSLLVSGLQFYLQDAVHAVATLSIFLAAGTRIAPAVLRIQQNSILIRSSVSASRPTIELINSLGTTPDSHSYTNEVDTTHVGFAPVVSIKAVDFSYPGARSPTLKSINLNIDRGESVAIVGPSGAGKTTLVDLILGVLEPESGKIEISGLTPSQTVTKWPGAVAYVPQDCVIVNGTIRQNVALGYPIESATDELVLRAIKVAQLEEYVNSLELGLDTNVGDRGSRLSGGQRQRLGIARAMFTQPKILVLDEATSALDGETELNLGNAILGLKGRVTVIVIAHRLSTIRDTSKIAYINRGQIQAIGTFDELRLAIPDFDNQAKAMGL